MLPAWLSTGDQRWLLSGCFIFKKREKQGGGLLGGPLGSGGTIQAEEWRRKHLDERDTVSPERCMHARMPQHSWRERERAHGGGMFCMQNRGGCPLCCVSSCPGWFSIYPCIIDYPIICLMISVCGHLCIYSFSHHVCIPLFIHHFSIHLVCMPDWLCLLLSVCMLVHSSIHHLSTHPSIYISIH